MAIHGAVRAGKSLTIVPHDTDEIDPPLEGLYVGGTGTIKFKLVNDTTFQTVAAVPIGTLFSGWRFLVIHTDSTASLMVGVR